MELKYAELQTPLFLAGTNLQMKLDPLKRTGLALNYDRESHELHVSWKGEMAIVPLSNVVSMVAGKIVQPKPEPPKIRTTPISAQVESPMSHVFEGPGKGKTK